MFDFSRSIYGGLSVCLSICFLSICLPVYLSIWLSLLLCHSHCNQKCIVLKNYASLPSLVWIQLLLLRFCLYRVLCFVTLPFSRYLKICQIQGFLKFCMKNNKMVINGDTICNSKLYCNASDNHQRDDEKIEACLCFSAW